MDPAANYAMCNTNSDMLVHWIDQVTERLNGMKSLIQDDEDREDPDGQLMDTFVHSWEARVRVVAGIEPGSETSLHGQLPTAGEGIMQMFLGGRRRQAARQDRRQTGPHQVRPLPPALTLPI